MDRLYLSYLLSLLLVAIPTMVCAQIQVVVSIKPIHSLVASVMVGTGKPRLIIDGTGSPHSYALRPSQAELLSRANVVFWLGRDLETFLDKPIKTIASKAQAIELMKAPGLITLPIRDINAFANFSQRNTNYLNRQNHTPKDAHVWLDPRNAKVIVQTIARTMSEMDPVNSSLYYANSVSTLERLDNLSNDIKVLLEPVKTRTFITVHDAFQYFERSYDLSTAGVITIVPEATPSANRIRKIKTTIETNGVGCVFSEPQFNPKLINTVIDGTQIKTAILDPLGTSFNAGLGQYFLMMREIATTFRKCLTPIPPSP